MPKRRAASRWLSPSTWQAWRTRAYSSTAFILTLPAVRTGRKIRRRLFTPPPRPDTPAASVRDFLSAAYSSPCHRVVGPPEPNLVFFLGRQSWLAKELFEPAEVGSGIAAELRPQHPGVPTALEARAHLAPALAIDTGQIAGVPAAQPGDETGGEPHRTAQHRGRAVCLAARRAPRG